MRRLRAVRVDTPPIRVRIARLFGRLVNVSATGALIRTHEQISPSGEWPLRLEVAPEAVQLQARVVRSEPVPVDLPGGTLKHPEYAVAVTFTQVPAEAMEAIAQLCGESFEIQE